MTKRRILIVGFVLATTACAVPIIAYVFRDPINESACEKIQEGMTEAEVTRILGRACDREYSCDEKVPEQASDGSLRMVPHRGNGRIWNGPAGTIHVFFEEPGVVQNVQFEENEDYVLPKIRRWLGLDPPPTPYRIHRGVGPTSSSI